MIAELEREVRDLALKYALQNAVKHNGKADLKAVMSKVLGERNDLRPYARQIRAIVEDVINYVNSLSVEEQRRLLADRWPELLEERRTVVRKDIESLPHLPNYDEYEVITLRFAPNPDFALTLGNARSAIINYAYKLKYEALGKKVKLILRFEDTDPKIKKPMVEMYKQIREDLRWLGIRCDEEYVQSERLDTYYEYAKKLIERSCAYVCTCNADRWRREFRDRGAPCPCRSLDPSANLERWERMLSGEYKEGDAVLRIKTDLAHPDPSVRDWVAFRIVDPERNPHPYLAHKYGIERAIRYRVWPTYNFAVSIDDHLMGVTHVLRAQEHRVNTVKQSYIFNYLGWRQPETIHFGRLHIEGFELSKSKLRALGVRYDDPRLPTLAGLRERGIAPETIWEIMLQVGIKQTDATIFLKNLYAINRKHLDPIANRYMAVIDPVEMIVEGVKEEIVVRIPYHPSYPDRGFREYKIAPRGEAARVYVSRSDLDVIRRGSLVRLMEFANVKLVEERDNVVLARVHSYDLVTAMRVRAQIIQWVPADSFVRVTIVRVDKNMADEHGLGEKHLVQLKVGDVVQLVRYGFAKVKSVSRELDSVTLQYIHE